MIQNTLQTGSFRDMEYWYFLFKSAGIKPLFELRILKIKRIFAQLFLEDEL